MAELEAYERDFGRAQLEYWAETAAAHRRGPRRRGGGPRRRPRRGRDHPRRDRRHEHRDLGDRLARRRPRRHDLPRAPRRRRAAVHGLRPLRRRPRLRRVRRRRVRRRDRRPVRSADHARDEARLASRTSCGRPGSSCPSARIADIAHERGALVLVDGAQAAGAIPVNVRDLGADMYAIPAQKWLLGPEGLGALWVRRELLADAASRRSPSYFTFASLDSRGNRTLADRCPALPGRRLPPAVRRRDGPRDRLADDVRRASTSCTAAAPRWRTARPTCWPRSTASTLLTPRDRMAGLVSFRIARLGAAAGARRAPGADVLHRPHAAAGRTRCGSASASGRPRTSSTGSSTASGSSPRTRPRRIPPRRTLTIVGQD